MRARDCSSAFAKGNSDLLLLEVEFDHKGARFGFKLILLIEVARSLAGTRAFKRSRQGCKRIEMLFARLKQILRMGRLPLRRPCGAQDGFLLGANAQNLRKLTILATPTEPQAISAISRGQEARRPTPARPQASPNLGQSRCRHFQRDRHFSDLKV